MPKKRKPKPYLVSLVLRGAEPLKIEGDSVLECLEQIKPEVVKSRGVLIAESEGKTSKKILNIQQIKRMAVNPTLRAIFAKTLTTYLA